MGKPPANVMRRYRGVCACGIETYDYRNLEIAMSILIEKCKNADPTDNNQHDRSIEQTTYSFMDY
jgi:hypothetical protein